jgi:hypothetical protein
VTKSRQFSVLISYSIKKITHHWRMTGNDTSENWCELHYDDSNGKSKSMRMPFGFDQYFKFAPDHRSLFSETFNAERARADYDAIVKWEKRNARELAEYKRLKAKFEGGDNGQD